MRFTCRQGHEWDAAASAGDRAICPRCGNAGRQVAGPSKKSRIAETQDDELSATTDYSKPNKRRRKPTPTPEDEPDLTPLPLANDDSDSPAPPEIPGHTILSVLGRGGMGVVYKARDLERKQLVALKMILVGGQASKQDLARFRTEAQAIANLQHPNIVRLYQIGEAAGHPYFTLELAEGGSLAKQLDGKPWPARKAARLVRTLAQAIHHAHQRNIIHRDLKPHNVLLAADGTPKITDFGLAKQLDTSGCQTPSEAILGTPSYMAPEQAGQAKHVGPAADIYSLGAILYELVTGQPPFEGDTVLDIIRQVTDEDPVPPRLIRPDLPSELETICLKCLQKLPGERYSSAQALANDLRRFVDGEPVRARRPKPWDGAIAWCRENPGIAILIGVIVLLFVGSLLQTMWFF